MKKLITFAFLFFVSYSLHAQQAPDVISYQGLMQGVNGSRVTDSTYPITVILWSDADGGTPLWQDVFQAEVHGGVFNLLLGSQTPLPPSQVMDHPLWISVSLGEFSEASQRSRLSTVPMAINVADSSITAKKIGTDYVSSVTIDGTQITSRGSALNFKSGEGVQFRFDSSSNAVTANVPLAPIENAGANWGENGNYGTTPGTNYVGTSDSVALEIHVNHNGYATDGNGRVMRYEPMIESPNVIGGYNGNEDSASTSGGNVIAGGGSLLHPNKAVIDFSTVGGGAGNTAINNGTVAGGGQNTAQEEAFIGGGVDNYAGYLAVVGGGWFDTAKYYGAVVSGGILNKALDTLATVSGGTGNTATTLYSTVGGGSTNLASGYASTVAGGYQNGATGLESAVGGGYLNSADTLSAIPGGYRLQLTKNSFGFNAGGIGSETTLSDTNVGFFGNVNLWIANSDNTARQLRLYAPNTDVDFGDHSQPYTSFQYNSTATIHYILPVSPGGEDQVLTNDGTGQLFWGAAVGTGQWSITGNHGTNPPTNFLGTTDSNSLELHVFDSGSTTYGAKRVMRYEVNDTSANIIGGYHANAVSGTHLVGVTIAGGGLNGHPNVAKGSYAVIAGGRRNTDTAFAFVGGGDSNLAMGAYSAVVGGTINVASGNSAVVGGGSNNVASANSAAVTGGSNNIASGNSAVVGGGSNNSALGAYSSVGGGDSNRATGDHAVISGGANDSAKASFSSIVGGDSNKVRNTANYSNIGGGFGNIIDSNASYAGILGGKYNLNQSTAATIVGGDNDTVSSNAPYAGILSGMRNVVQDTSSVIVGGDSNKVSSSYSIIGSGSSNTITSSSPYTSILAGRNNLATGYYNMIGAGTGNVINASWGFIGTGQNDSVTGQNNGIGAGENNAITGGGIQSFIGSGVNNKVGGTFGLDFIGSGESNFVSADFDFVGAGFDDTILGGFSGIGTGSNNRIGMGDNMFAFIGGGTFDTALVMNSFIGGGSQNVTDTGATHAVGKFASIPGGQGLKTQSYSQTAMGFYNLPAGSTSDEFNAQSAAHADDPLVIVGNGLPDSMIVHTVLHRGSDAFTVANAGYSSVYDNIGSGVNPSNPTRMGSTYANNTTIAWGNVLAGAPFDTAAANIGVKKVVFNSDTTYTVTLNVLNQDGSPHTFTAGAAAIVATLSQGLSGTPGIITVSPLSGGAVPTFTVTTFLLTGRPTGTFGFQFHVVAK